MRAESERLEEESRGPGRQEEEEEGGPALEDLRPASEPISQSLPLWRATGTGGVHRCFTEFRDTSNTCQVHLKRAEEILHLGLSNSCPERDWALPQDSSSPTARHCLAPVSWSYHSRGTFLCVIRPNGGGERENNEFKAPFNNNEFLLNDSK